MENFISKNNPEFIGYRIIRNEIKKYNLTFYIMCLCRIIKFSMES